MNETDFSPDELRPEYDLDKLQVRRMGPGRQRFGDTVRLAPDVAKMFPDAESVNEALRFLIRVSREKKPPRKSKAASVDPIREIKQGARER